MFYKKFNTIFVLCFFHTVLIYKFFCKLIKLLPANFLAGNFFIVYLQSVKTI